MTTNRRNALTAIGAAAASLTGIMPSDAGSVGPALLQGDKQLLQALLCLREAGIAWLTRSHENGRINEQAKASFPPPPERVAKYVDRCGDGRNEPFPAFRVALDYRCPAALPAYDAWKAACDGIEARLGLPVLEEEEERLEAIWNRAVDDFFATPAKTLHGVFIKYRLADPDGPDGSMDESVLADLRALCGSSAPVLEKLASDAWSPI